MGLYEKFELRIDLEATYANPYDPEEIDLRAEFTSPSGKQWTIWGFYNPSDWSRLWMVRFAPTEKGSWSYVVKVTDREGTAQSRPRTFTAVESAAPRLRPHRTESALPLPTATARRSTASACGTTTATSCSIAGRSPRPGSTRLQQLGVNFISFFPTPLETMGTGLGRYDENRCGRLDQLFEWCEQRDDISAAAVNSSSSAGQRRVTMAGISPTSERGTASLLRVSGAAEILFLARAERRRFRPATGRSPRPDWRERRGQKHPGAHHCRPDPARCRRVVSAGQALSPRNKSRPRNTACAWCCRS